MSGARCKVGIDADNWSDPFLLAGLVELDCAVEVAVVRQGKCMHLIALGGFHEVADSRERIEEGVVAMGVQVDETPRRHSYSIAACVPMGKMRQNRGTIVPC